MVEGLDARSLLVLEKGEQMVVPGAILFLIGLLMPILIRETSEFYGSFSRYDAGAFNIIFSSIMFLGLFMSAVGIMFRERGQIHRPTAVVLAIALAVDTVLWFYLPTVGLSTPSGLISLLPFLSPAQIPLGITVIFVLLVLAARSLYRKDPRKSGKPKYNN